MCHAVHDRQWTPTGAHFDLLSSPHSMGIGPNMRGDDTPFSNMHCLNHV